MEVIRELLVLVLLPSLPAVLHLHPNWKAAFGMASF
jgi:hypothetical protein